MNRLLFLDGLRRTLALRRLSQKSFDVVASDLLALRSIPPMVDAAAHRHDADGVAVQGRFGVPAALHVANALAEEALGLPDGRINEAPPARPVVLERLPEWRVHAAEEQRRPAARPDRPRRPSHARRRRPTHPARGPRRPARGVAMSAASRARSPRAEPTEPRSTREASHARTAR